MTPNDWQRVQLLFEQAASLPVIERAAFVEKVCLEDPELGRRLDQLLQADASGGSFVPFFDIHHVLSANASGGQAAASAYETATMTGIAPGRVLAGRFRLYRHIGKGGMGDVYEAEDLQLGERVALKTIRTEIAANPTAVARFKREILLGKQVTHTNVCRIHDLGVAQTDTGQDLLFLTMEFLDGETLASRIKRGPVPVDEAFPLMRDMAEALTAAHTAGVIHRDFKSGNVMLVNSPDGVRAVVTDFGLAWAFRPEAELSELTKTGGAGGTVEYMAPEQIRGEEVTPAADIYSLGVVVYQMVTGRLPFTGGSDLAIAMGHVNDEPPSPRQFAPELDSAWEAAILRCLRKSPAQRFSSTADLEAAFVLGRGSTAPRILRLRTAPFVAALAAAAMIALGYGGWNYHQRIPHQQRVAVLPFENIGGDPANRAFCDGLMESLASKLTELEQFQGSLSVVPASDIRREKVTSAREAQREFGANLAITGSVERSPGGAELIVNVVDARQVKQLRSRRMFVPDSDALSMQQGVITQVTGLLDIQLRPEARQRLAQGNSAVPGAYDYYLQGSGYLLSGRVGLDHAIAEFRHALDRDPNYALGHAGLGEAYWDKYLATKDREWIDRARQECQRAVELGPQLAATHVALAVLDSGSGRYDEAIRQAREAIDLDPGGDRAYSELARALEATNQPAEAEATLKKAIALRPGYWNNYVRLGIFYSAHGRYQEALGPFNQVIELVPDDPAGYTDLGSTYHLLGREADAERLLQKSIQVRPTALAYSNLATVYFFEKRYADAIPIYEKLTAGGANDFGIWGNLGDAYRWTPGNAEKAATAYRHAIELAAQRVAVNPRDPRALIALALYRAKTGQSAPAVRNMEAALMAAPEDESIIFYAAIVCELTGSRARALEYLAKAIRGGYSLNEIAAEPELSKLRQSPSFQALVNHNN